MCHFASGANHAELSKATCSAWRGWWCKTSPSSGHRLVETPALLCAEAPHQFVADISETRCELMSLLVQLARAISDVLPASVPVEMLNPWSEHHHETDHPLELAALLQHPAIRCNIGIVCSLLCTSRATAAAVSPHLAGQVQVQYTAVSSQQTSQLELWLYRNAGLVRSLQFTSTCRHVSVWMTAACCVAA